jgi:hypothetical protein
MIHHAVHSARPDVNCVAHSHSIYGRTFCALGRPLDMITQDSCAFYNDLALYSSFRGIVLESDEGAAIATALGDKKAALLQNHGLLTCGKTIEATIFWFMSLEKCCHSQLMADAAVGGCGGAVSTFAVFGDPFLTMLRLSRLTIRMLLILIKRTINFPAPCKLHYTLYILLSIPTFLSIVRSKADVKLRSVGSEMAGWFSAKPTFDMMALEAGKDGQVSAFKGSKL